MRREREEEVLPAVRLKDNAGAHQAVAAQRLNIVMTPLVRCSLVVLTELPLFPRSQRLRMLCAAAICQM
jgi:hypothetical protein